MKKTLLYPALFFDIDATLVDPLTGLIPKNAIKEIQKIRNKGYRCCLASGREYHNALNNTTVFQYPWDGYIGANGQQIVDQEGKFLQNEYLSEELVNKIIQLAEKLNHSIVLVLEDKWELITKPDKNTYKSFELFHYEMLEPVKYQGEKVVYAIAFADLGYDYHDYAKLGLSPALSYYPYADLVLAGCTKAKAIEKYLQHYNLKEYIGFGDSMNDYEMLKHADLAIAMGSGDPQLQKIADIVTKPLTQDGLALTLKEIQDKYLKKEVIK